jgi:S-adenosylmethionine decarboxylase proenzyme
MIHLIGHLSGTVIETVQDLENRMDAVVRDCDLTVVTRAFHQFRPIGATGVIVLAESHFSAHTYPEHGLVYVDVFCCSPSFDPKVCAESLRVRFGGVIKYQNINRALE